MIAPHQGPLPIHQYIGKHDFLEALGSDDEQPVINDSHILIPDRYASRFQQFLLEDPL